MSAQPHVLVLGLGIVGSSIAATLAEKGFPVTAVEQFTALHERGSSHGDSRIYRRVPHEGPVYVEMAARCWDGWKRWGERAGEDLLVACGGIDAGPEGSDIVMASEKLGLAYENPCEMLSGAAVNRRYPHYNLPPAWIAAFHPQSGFVRPDATRTYLHKMAREAGARLIHETSVIEINSQPSGVTIRTARETIQGDVLIVAAGSWLPKLLPELDLPLLVERRVMAWFQTEQNEILSDGRLPIFCLDGEDGWYGMPTLDGRMKLGHNHHFNEHIDPDQPTMEPNDADTARLMPCVERYFRGFTTKPSALKACVYTLMPDHNFIIDQHPNYANVFLFSCCSGHGFKYAPEYGEIAADLVSGKARPDLAALGLNRRGPGAVWAG